MKHSSDEPTRADKHRQRMARKSREQSASVADIGDIPPIVNPERRAACERDLHKFLVDYFPQSTGLKPLSDDHRRFITRLQNCILDGGLFVQAMPRGFAKTTIGELASLWATIYGHRKFVPVFGASANNATSTIDSIKMELAENDLLMEDFPEVCHPVRALENKVQRCRSQTHQGNPTYIAWTADTIVLPSIAGSKASGAILTAHGLHSASRGIRHKRQDGTVQRPDFAFIDDPQTDTTASSPIQVRKLMGIIKKAVLKSAGHGKKIAVFAAVTVIAKDDLADQLLNQKLNPAWQSERIKMVKAWSNAHETLWQEYAEIRNTYNPDDLHDQKRAHRQATDFYRAKRAAMDEGCIVSWDYCFDEEVEISAIQHAYNALIDDGPEVFASEYQNEPLEETVGDGLQMKPAAIAAKLNGIDRGMVPIGCEHITAHIDVQESSLWWTVVAWSTRFDGYVLDYGIWPEQGSKRYITLRDVKRTMMDAAAASARDKGEKVPGLEGAIYFGLDTLTNTILSREWRREDGSMLKVAQLLVDANWQRSTDSIYLLARQSKFSDKIMPAHGRGIGAVHTPMAEHRKKIGDRVGLNWKVPAIDGRRAVRHVSYDTNYWKSFVGSRLSTPMGDTGCLSLFGNDDNAHKCLADHYVAEYPTTVEARERKVVEWRLRPGRDNHWLDNIVGCAVAASMLGCSLMAGGEYVSKRKTRPLRKSWK
jgi:hypothetical protein